MGLLAVVSIAFLSFVHITNGEFCSHHLITGPKGVEDSSLSASSQSSFGNGRIPSIRMTSPTGFGWMPAHVRKDEYIQIDFQETSAILAIVSRGKGSSDQYITSFTVSSSQDGVIWDPIEDDNGTVQIFNGSTDDTSNVTNKFQKPIIAKYFRVAIQTWNKYPVLRMELIGCVYNKQSALRLYVWFWKCTKLLMR